MYFTKVAHPIPSSSLKKHRKKQHRGKWIKEHLVWMTKTPQEMSPSELLGGRICVWGVVGGW